MLRACGHRRALGGTAPPQKAFVATSAIDMEESMKTIIAEGSPIWYKGWVRLPAALATTPAGERFTASQAMVWRRLQNGKWLIFDEAETYLILSTADRV